MRFQIEFTQSAEKDTEYFTKYEQRIIITGIRRFLSEDANVETKRKKQLRPNKLAPWELKIGNFRVFYGIEKRNLAKIIAVGVKEHDELFVRGKRVEL
ncbi:MAG: type II toxin-antitoxin system RelE/ParE family toxin [bacterium]